MTIRRNIFLCATLCALASIALPSAHAFGHFFCVTGIDNDYCAHDLANAHQCPQHGNDQGRQYFATHFPQELNRCRASNTAVCAAGHGPHVCHRGDLNTAPVLNIAPPVRGPTAAYTEAQSRAHLVDTLLSIGSAVADAAGFEVAGTIIGIVQYFEGTFGTSTPAQCAHGMVPLSDGHCLNWQHSMQEISNYVSQYVNYQFDVERAHELMDLMKFVYHKFDEVSGYTPNSRMQITAAQILSDHMDEHVQDWKNWINLPPQDFVNSLIAGGNTHKMVNGELVAHVTTDQDVQDNWALASAFPHYADMHLTVKMLLLAHELKTGDHTNIYNIAGLRSDGHPGPDGLVHDRTFTIRTMVQDYFAMKSMLQWKMHQVRLHHIKGRWENTYSLNRCYNTQDGQIEHCDGHAGMNQPHSSDHLTAFIVVEDTWPACRWEATLTNRYLTFDASDANCKGIAWCENNDPHHADPSTAASCLGSHRDWAMTHWDNFWTSVFTPYERKWNMIDNKVFAILRDLNLPHPVRRAPPTPPHHAPVSRIPTDPALLAQQAPENQSARPANCDCDPNSSVEPTSQCMDYCMTRPPQGWEETSRRLKMETVAAARQTGGRLRGSRVMID